MLLWACFDFGTYKNSKGCGDMVQVYVVIGAIVFWIIISVIVIALSYYLLIGITILIGTLCETCCQSRIVQQVLKNKIVRREKVFYRQLNDDLLSSKEIQKHFWYLSQNLDVLRAISITMWRNVNTVLHDYYDQTNIRQNDRTFLIETAKKIHKYIPE